MIGKIIKGQGFRGVLEYALQKEKGKLIWTNMASCEPRGLAKEFGAIRQIKPRFKNAVFHAALSAPKNQNTTEEMWIQIALAYLKKMGFSKSQCVIVKHSDTEHDHIHIIANRITFDGLVVSDSKDFEKQEKALRAIEMDFGLVPLKASRKSAVKGPTQGEKAKSDRTGEYSSRMLLQGYCTAAAEMASGFEDYLRQLKEFGVKATLYTKDSKQTLKGIVYELDGFKIASGKLGREFMAEGLAERGIVYSLQAPVLAPAAKQAEQEVPGEVLVYMRDALDSYTRFYGLEIAQQEQAWRAWLKRDPQFAMQWCAGWNEGVDMGHIPKPQERLPEVSQEQTERPQNRVADDRYDGPDGP